MDDDTAAVLLEVVQGEGGVIPGDGQYLREAQKLCTERGTLLIVDEVQTGFGRTGRMFASQHHGLEPDLMCVAKGMAGGLPMGAVLMGSRVGKLQPRVHGSTFGGYPLVCAAALAAIEFIEARGLPGQAARLGTQLIEGLSAIESPLIRQVRGLGLMVAVELKGPAGPHLAALAELGVLALSAGASVMRFLPPLVISQAQIETIIERTEAVLSP
jgi:acetylornithine/LysW-gamma-L-lysine aminotransferase